MSVHTEMPDLSATYAKPAGSRWTDEQWAAIAADGTRLLVAAAAGSGKTAVLVERIISRIADEARPLDVDALLVATFTKAAAAEMKERIRIALEDALERKPDSAHLRRQLALLPRASITTLHSFCMEVLEKYAPLIGLDPGFRIANETEAELMRMDTLDALFEERYETEGEHGTLARLADLFGGERSDEPLHRLALELYDFSRSHPEPDAWLARTAAGFRVANAEALADTPWVQSMRADVLLALEGAVELLRGAQGIAALPGGPQPYADTLADDLDVVLSLLETVRAKPWAQWREAFAEFAFGRLKPCRGDGYDPALQEQVKQARDDAKKTVNRLADEWFVRTPEQYASEMRALAPDMAELAALVIAFGERYEAAKRAKGLLDFGDLEHYALRILRDPASVPGRVVPSPAALDYRERFREILLDEYQDTNEVQEAIVSLIAKVEPGNVFMVGDVKQSIYRFRLAEPGLFLAKYKSYDVWTPQGTERGERTTGAGLRVDLARNFRSRARVLDAVNHVFRQIMREPVGEMNYDRRAELIYGNGYPPDELDAEDLGLTSGERNPYQVEMILIEAGAGTVDEEGDAAPAAGEREEASEAGETPAVPEEDLAAVQLEARCIAEEIRRLMGTDGSGKPPFAVYDGKSGLHRPLAYRDVVILLRAATSLAPAVLEELQGAGIPAYADLATGYFAATEVDVMLSLLHLIDNPDQDIPLAGVLRSPLVGLDAEQLARIRIVRRSGSFWDAVRTAAGDDSGTVEAELRAKLSAFAAALESWRNFARREPLGELLHMLYRDTGYYDFVGGLPGGVQRQANLRALVDRARQYERNSSFRGLFRFLRFLSRMRDTGADLGAARAIGEQEDVVRVVSIHKSKGLEFPVVFVAGLGRQFNRQDLNGMFLKHKKLGFGPRMVEQVTRVAYPTLPQLAIRRRLQAEMLAEEMRVLYVALTRPKEKLILVGTTKDAQKELQRWSRTAASAAEGLPAHAVAAASRYLDWLGPASLSAGSDWRLGTSSGAPLPASAGESGASSTPPWSCRVVPAAAFMRAAAAAAETPADGEPLWNLVQRLEPVPVAPSPAGEQAAAALSWSDPHAAAARAAAKTSITAMKQQRQPMATASDGLSPEEFNNEEARHPAWNPEELPDAATMTYRLRRPKFLSAKRLTPAERGSAVHLAMQHLPLREDLGVPDVEAWLEKLVADRILTPEQREAIGPEAIVAFGRTPLFARMRSAERLWREWPFSAGIPAEEAHPGLFEGERSQETVLIQGVIDVLFPGEDGLVLVDYKTDTVFGDAFAEAAEKHRFQMEQYAGAIGRIMGEPVAEGYIYFIDGGRTVRLF
ncbi:UvrD-helicase domain-containing protein [Cohnella nanjingensis]|uniref:ATP-dependent helicase/nuclease subunit A n=1 Tax=Cohnella nanjingensis TaxID=1387779 RepID=A0A7X0RXA3_9BACL|nr:UvrD-helicase domain-containing protein [Cohnella nanjingensis]MBB6675378.1 UvrD-helicase domain-containing protein [Cohnella nanjingensis]